MAGALAMNADLKKQWLERLKTDKRCSVTLRHGECFCALGVLADIVIQQNPRYKWDGEAVVDKETGDQFVSYLPEDMAGLNKVQQRTVAILSDAGSTNVFPSGLVQYIKEKL